MAKNLVFEEKLFIDGIGGIVREGRSHDSFRILEEETGELLFESFNGIIPREFLGHKVSIKYVPGSRPVRKLGILVGDW